jgi:hypothetical protein
MHLLISTLFTSIISLSSASLLTGSDPNKIENKNSTKEYFQNPSQKKSAVEFKNQKYCRVELEDFDFDAKFTILSATVYFSGANFTSVQVRNLNSNSLKPIEDLQKRCTSGTIVVFDNIKVIGPDNVARIIDGATYNLF